MRTLPWIQKIVFSCLFSLSITSYAADNANWRSLLPGLQYTELTPQTVNPWGRIHAFRIDLKLFKFNLAFASEIQQKTTTVPQFAYKSNALLATNGGFFSTDLKPIGLRIDNGIIKNPLKKFSWSGIFYIPHSQPYRAKISNYREFKAKQQVDFAIQSGPRLVINNSIPKLKTGIAERTALGITQDNKIILAVTQHAPMTTYQLAELMHQKENEGGLNCKNALNLDGGSSTQLYAHIKHFRLSVQGYATVTDGVVVNRRQGTENG